MTAEARSKSPGAVKGAKKEEEKQNGEANDVTAAGIAAPKFVAPPRPKGLRKQLLLLHAALAASVLFFSLVGQAMKHPVPEGKFEKKDGTLIDLDAFDAVELGPYPKCHPHHGEHQAVEANGTTIWVKNSDVGSAGPFPVGHPENPEWNDKWHKEAIKDTHDQRFTWAGLQPNLHLLSLAMICVYLGSLHGVWLWTEHLETRETFQTLESKDAYWFPVMGSCTLLGLFLVLKYLGNDLIKTLITGGVVFLCMFAIGGNLEHLYAVVKRKVSAPLFTLPLLDEQVTLVELFGMVVGGTMAGGYMWSKHWIINNLFGVSFCLGGIKVIQLSSYKVGAIMLVGLFFYDVFWVFGSKSVFGSNVMVSVAKGVDAPIKLLFPRNMGGCGVLLHSMLGLGDIVVPGIFIAWLAKWDAHLMGEKKSTSFVYLNTTMVAYFFSLVTTVCIMLFFHAAQPALLYIVPYVLLASVGVAISRGEVKAIWDYVISEEENPKKGTTNGETTSGDKKDK